MELEAPSDGESGEENGMEGAVGGADSPAPNLLVDMRTREVDSSLHEEKPIPVLFPESDKRSRRKRKPGFVKRKGKGKKVEGKSMEEERGGIWVIRIWSCWSPRLEGRSEGISQKKNHRDTN